MKLDYDIFEIILLPDESGYIHIETPIPNHVFIRINPTGPCLPSYKRDHGVQEANGNIIAFIDADAFPPYWWLRNAVYLLERPENEKSLSGICGPGVLPPEAGFWQSASDLLLSILPYNYRVKYQPARYVDDYPTFNLIMWKDDINKVGGFKCNYLTGEDTLLCLKIKEKLHKKILYSPMVDVYHDRRPLFRPFLKQVATYGKHRGYFFKKHPGTSRRLIYICPSLFVFVLSVWLLLWGLSCLF